MTHSHSDTALKPKKIMFIRENNLKSKHVHKLWGQTPSNGLLKHKYAKNCYHAFPYNK